MVTQLVIKKIVTQLVIMKIVRQLVIKKIVTQLVIKNVVTQLVIKKIIFNWFIPFVFIYIIYILFILETYYKEDSHTASHKENSHTASHTAPTFHCRFHNGPPFVCILRQINPVSGYQSYFFKTHLLLGLSSGLFPSDFPTKTLFAPLLFPIRATCPARIFVLDLIRFFSWCIN